MNLETLLLTESKEMFKNIHKYVNSKGYRCQLKEVLVRTLEQQNK